MIFLLIFLVLVFASRRTLGLLSGLVSLLLLCFSGLFLLSEQDPYARSLFGIAAVVWLWIWPFGLLKIWKKAGLHKVSDLRLRRG